MLQKLVFEKSRTRQKIDYFNIFEGFSEYLLSYDELRTSYDMIFVNCIMYVILLYFNVLIRLILSHH